MTNELALSDLPGGRELVDWFGFAPRFHDANLLEISLISSGPSHLRLHAFRMNSDTDEQGYYRLDKHALITITLDDVTQIHLSDFDVPGIISDLRFLNVEGEIEVGWTSSYGGDGYLRAKQVRLGFVPGKPA